MDRQVFWGVKDCQKKILKRDTYACIFLELLCYFLRISSQKWNYWIKEEAFLKCLAHVKLSSREFAFFYASNSSVQGYLFPYILLLLNVILQIFIPCQTSEWKIIVYCININVSILILKLFYSLFDNWLLLLIIKACSSCLTLSGVISRPTHTLNIEQLPSLLLSFFQIHSIWQIHFVEKTQSYLDHLLCPLGEKRLDSKIVISHLVYILLLIDSSMFQLVNSSFHMSHPQSLHNLMQC